MARIVEFLKREITEAAGVMVYFVVAFGTIGLLIQLFLVQFDVEFAGVAKAVIGGLVVGKIVVVLDKTRAGERFHDHPVWMSVLYRSLVYTFFVAIVLSLEKGLRGYLEAGTLAGGFKHALDAAGLSRGTATSICLFLSFIGYCLINEVKRAVGREHIVRFLFDRRGRTQA